MVDYAFSLRNTEQLEGAWFYNEKAILRVIIENEMKDERNAGSICSDPTCGGRNYILKWVFFVQKILADRYIHRREM